ncbi:MAG: hypothetical protein QXF26_05150 [Candidatus Bathyarchaeia archaeon]
MRLGYKTELHKIIHGREIDVYGDIDECREYCEDPVPSDDAVKFMG